MLLLTALVSYGEYKITMVIAILVFYNQLFQ